MDMEDKQGGPQGKQIIHRSLASLWGICLVLQVSDSEAMSFCHG